MYYSIHAGFSRSDGSLKKLTTGGSGRGSCTHPMSAKTFAIVLSPQVLKSCRNSNPETPITFWRKNLWFSIEALAVARNGRCSILTYADKPYRWIQLVSATLHPALGPEF